MAAGKKAWRVSLRGMLLVLVTVLGIAGLSRLGWLGSYNRAFLDLCHRLAGQREAPGRVALVLVDDSTLSQWRDKPLVFWGPHFAQAIGVLRRVGVRVIGLDYLFLVSAESWLASLGADAASRTYDAPFRAQLASGSVVLIGQLAADDEGRVVFLLPIEDYRLVLPGGDNDIGWANLRTDPDGVVRHFWPVFIEEGPAPRLSLGMLLAVRAAGLDPQASSWRLAGRKIPARAEGLPIRFAGPPGTIPTISFSRLLEENAAGDPRVASLRDKVVIIGAGFRGAQDRHLTPYGQENMMNGAEVQANIAGTLLAGAVPRQIGELTTWLVVLVLVALASFGFFWLGPLRGALLAVGLGGLWSLLAYGLFLQDLRLPVGPGHLGLGLCYLGAIGLRLTGEERRRRHLRRVFGQYVSDEVVEKLLRSGRRPDLGGELLTVTILFSDIRNFTTISERLNAHEVVDMLNTYFSQACEAIFQQGGTIDKFVGDAVMAVFGSPVLQDDHPRRALTAALEMQEIASEYRRWLARRYRDRDLPEFCIGVGIHTGEAVVGNIGSPKRLEYTVIGDTVNLAARLEGLTKQLDAGIVVSSATAGAAGPGLLLGKRQRIQVKGKQEQIEVSEFLGFEEK